MARESVEGASRVPWWLEGDQTQRGLGVGPESWDGSQDPSWAGLGVRSWL